jgi:hypothetical protein
MFDPTAVARDAKRERNGCRRRVSVQVDGCDDFVWSNSEFLCRCIDDAAIGLVGHEPVDVVGRQSQRIESASVIIDTALRKTSRPSIRNFPTVCVVEGPPSMWSLSPWRPSERR